MEAKYNQQLMEEFEKYQNMQNLSIEKQDDWQQQMRKMDADAQRNFAETQAEAEARLNQKSAEISKVWVNLWYFISRFVCAFVF